MAISRRNSPLLLLITYAFLSFASAEVFFEELFEEGWDKRWIKSDWKKDENMAGEWRHTSGKWSGDHDDKGIQTSKDYRFYAISAEFPEFSNKGRTLVFQFSVKHEQKLDCGGGYMKLLSGKLDQKQFGGDTPYSIMFGPDICGYETRRVHVIFSRNEKNHLIKRNIVCPTDQLTHLYTLILRPNGNYSVLIDNVEKKHGSLYTDWDILPPRQIKDPDATKPEDWDDRDYIPDPEDEKPEGYDDIPKEMPAPGAEKPEDWEDEEDGEWVPPTMPNPEYKGPWVPKQIKNPNYQGKWKAPMIDNPEFKDDPDIYVYPNLRYVGIELWQVKSGTLFDNVLLCDDPEYAKQMAEETWGEQKHTEMEEFELAEAKRREEEKKTKDNEEDSEDEEEDDDGGSGYGGEEDDDDDDTYGDIDGGLGGGDGVDKGDADPSEEVDLDVDDRIHDEL
ncbi:calreticulin-like [Aristolochia californica]|uniref:calreticulin-like n=1 Tax=Aristolochia californica TaxID=171875 RepID=UPI0035E0E40D